ncbi:hypothetical protein SpiGrapes_1161 [Sphaerochaeta pleomorpha str. Grapes]|uniref:Uncharacterized protein n=1 Tax=Sphaerochaeta pleomorpha (strain ATCC BAA-1885 / DSM 22778 / Grapes) TaxID=158190 RepID=G8QSL8_SPHPG|nr:hypothetical protein [Sphaerochaeta pleomorpha]AEV28979.1 hypothetical protein SpiGrapes_1161 [Sphaerochaeta pleomorpha str. Grapes]
MKKRSLVLLLLVSILALTFISCDADIRSQIADLMDNVSGNVFLENGLLEANTAEAEAAAAVVADIGTGAGTTETNTSDGTNASVNVGTLPISVPSSGDLVTLAPQDADEQEELESDLAEAFNSPTQRTALVETLSQPATLAQVTAATGSIAVFNATVAQLQTSLTMSTALGTALGRLNITAPTTMTQADVLTMQLMTNLVNNVVTTLQGIATGGDLANLDDATLAENQTQILSIVDDALFAAQVAEELSGAANIDFFGQVDFGSLIEDLTKGTKDISLSDTGAYIQTINRLAPRIISLLGGSFANGSYTFTEPQYQSFLLNQQIYRAGLEQALVLMSRSGVVPTEVVFDSSTLVKYVLSVAITEFEDFYQDKKTASTTATPASIIAVYLTANPKLISGTLATTDSLGDFDSTGLGFVIENEMPGYLDSLGYDFFEALVNNLKTINSINRIPQLDGVLDDLLDTTNANNLQAWYDSLVE